jgi:hypothetical protein
MPFKEQDVPDDRAVCVRDGYGDAPAPISSVQGVSLELPWVFGHLTSLPEGGPETGADRCRGLRRR